ncbi:hypothetical protein FACS189490_08330 [Clostridia bacterium]|nr:hypothetical protein FACS189490_08330 [Clostridia bacterium]
MKKNNNNIVLANEADAERVMEIYTSYIGENGCTWHADYPNLDIVKADIAEKCLYRLNGENGEIIAVAAIGVDEELSQFDCWDKDVIKWCDLARVAVVHGKLRQGIAEKLVQFLIDEAKKRGYGGMRMLVGRKNERAIALYKKIGFVYCGECYAWETEWYCYQLKF